MAIRRNVEDICLVIDASRENQTFIAGLRANIAGQADKWLRAVEQFPGLRNTRFHLATSNLDSQNIGYTENFSDLLHVLCNLNLDEADETKISTTTSKLHAKLGEEKIASDLTLAVSKTVNPLTDMEGNLHRTGVSSEAPILTLVPQTKDLAGAQSNTTANHMDAMRVFAEGSGVKGGPVVLTSRQNQRDFHPNSDTEFVDYVIVAAAARAGVIDQLHRANIVSPAIWKQFSETTLRTINEPEKPQSPKNIIAPAPAAFTQAAQSSQGRRNWLPWALIPVAFLAGLGICKWLQEDCPVCPDPAETVDQPRVNTPVDDLRTGISFRFNNKAIGFGQDSADIPVEFHTELNEIGQYLQDNPNQYSKLIIEGHTSLEGDEAYNQALSVRRAQAIVDYLESNFTIREGLLEAKGFGEERPRYNPETSEQDKQDNRRVVFAPQL